MLCFFLHIYIIEYNNIPLLASTTFNGHFTSFLHHLSLSSTILLLLSFSTFCFLSLWASISVLPCRLPWPSSSGTFLYHCPFNFFKVFFWSFVWFWLLDFVIIPWYDWCIWFCRGFLIYANASLVIDVVSIHGCPRLENKVLVW